MFWAFGLFTSYGVVIYMYMNMYMYGTYIHVWFSAILWNCTINIDVVLYIYILCRWKCGHRSQHISCAYN